MGLDVSDDAEIEITFLPGGRTLVVYGDSESGICGSDGSLQQTSDCGLFGGWTSNVELYSELQSALTTGDAATVADLIRFPLRVNRSGATDTVDTELIEDRSVFHERFDELFTSRVIDDVLAADPREVFCRGADGAMIAHGRVWANEEGIFVLNDPD